jgi:GNAT superfamily N-acetyltransferase
VTQGEDDDRAGPGSAAVAPRDVGPRAAILQDAEAIAALHARVWHATYHALAPAAAIATLTAQARRVRWREMLRAPAAGQVTLVAEQGGALTGFGQLVPTAHPAFGGRREVRSLYVDAPHQGRGIGRRLLIALAQAAIAQGAAGIALGVVDSNAPAIAFYQRLGGSCVGRYVDAGPIWRSDNLVYAWDDLAALITPNAAPAA